MGDILLIDGNPDHVRPLSGLFKYRLKHNLMVVGDCVLGLRLIYTRAPDVILINTLLFATEDFGFARALAEDEAHASIKVIVLISGRLDEIRARSVEQFGASILELPASASEMTETISKASGLRRQTSAPQPVSWAQTELPAKKTPPPREPEAKLVTWAPLSADESEGETSIRAVNWAVDGVDGRGSRPKPSRSAKSSQKSPSEDASPKETGPNVFRPGFSSDGGRFRSMAESAEKVEESGAENEPRAFKVSDFSELKDVDPRKVKNR